MNRFSGSLWRQLPNHSSKHNAPPRNAQAITGLRSLHNSPFVRREVGPHNKRRQAQETDGETKAVLDPRKQAQIKARRHARIELKWLPDKASVAQRVQKALEEHNEDFALSIARELSKTPNAAVAPWNLLIKDRMNRTPLPHHGVALDYLNEMKKRQQTPDAYTYGTLLSGLGRHPRPQEIVEIAYALFMGMQKEGAAVRTTILNTNMMLRIAGRAGNMDIFWHILRDISETGRDAATAQTYTAIFEALTSNVNARLDNDPDNKARKVIYEQLKAARAIWGAAIDGWTHADMEIDSFMVCAYMRLLLAAPHASYWDQVYSVVEQVVGIPRFAPPVKPGNISFSADKESQVQQDIHKIYKPVENRTHAVMVPVTNQILTEILKVTYSLRSKSAASYYWDIVTGANGHNLQPDVVSLKAYLNVLRISRSSGEACKTVQKYQDQAALDFGVFRLAFSACERNAWDRPNTIYEATDLYKHRSKLHKTPDIKILESFAAVIDTSQKDKAKIAALELIDRDVALLFDQRPHAAKQLDHTNRLLELAKSYIGIYDGLINKGVVPPGKFNPMKSELAEFVRQHYQGDAEAFLIPKKSINPRHDMRNYSNRTAASYHM